MFHGIEPFSIFSASVKRPTALVCKLISLSGLLEGDDPFPSVIVGVGGGSEPFFTVEGELTKLGMRGASLVLKFTYELLKLLENFDLIVYLLIID